MQKVCENCQKTFITNRKDQRFCSADCRTKWHNHHDPNRSFAAYMERKKKAAIKRRGYSWEEFKEQLTRTETAMTALEEAIQTVKKTEKAQKKAEYEKKKAERARQEQESKEKIIADLLNNLDYPDTFSTALEQLNEEVLPEVINYTKIMSGWKPKLYFGSIQGRLSDYDKYLNKHAWAFKHLIDNSIWKLSKKFPDIWADLPHYTTLKWWAHNFEKNGTLWVVLQCPGFDQKMICSTDLSTFQLTKKPAVFGWLLEFRVTSAQKMLESPDIPSLTLTQVIMDKLGKRHRIFYADLEESND